MLQNCKKTWIEVGLSVIAQDPKGNIVGSRIADDYTVCPFHESYQPAQEFINIFSIFERLQHEIFEEKLLPNERGQIYHLAMGATKPGMLKLGINS